MQLTIRHAQLDAFTTSAREQYLTDMVKHVKTYFPSRHAQLGDVALRNTLAEVIKKAELYKFRNKRDICKFINVAMTFGVDFDRTIPLLGSILTTCGPASRKARRLSQTSIALYQRIKALSKEKASRNS